jgi:hypothetical protein
MSSKNKFELTWMVDELRIENKYEIKHRLQAILKYTYGVIKAIKRLLL